MSACNGLDFLAQFDPESLLYWSPDDERKGVRAIW